MYLIEIEMSVWEGDYNGVNQKCLLQTPIVEPFLWTFKGGPPDGSDPVVNEFLSLSRNILKILRVKGKIDDYDAPILSEGMSAWVKLLDNKTNENLISANITINATPISNECPDTLKRRMMPTQT